MGRVMERVLSAGSANGGFWVMDVISILLGIALMATIVGMVICHIERYQDLGRGLILSGPAIIVIATILGLRAY